MDVRITSGRAGGPGWSAALEEARKLAEEKGGPFRAPHHTVGTEALLSEVALAACGVLYLDQAEDVRATVLMRALSTVAHMHPRARPTVFLAVDDEKRRHVLAEAVQRAIELCPERRV